MARAGQRKYLCDGCGKDSYHHWIALNRAAKLRCPHCGCGRMEAVSDDARKETAARNSLIRDGGTRSAIRSRSGRLKP